MALAASCMRRVERLIKNSNSRPGANRMACSSSHVTTFFVLFRPHQFSGLEPEVLIERNEWTHLLFISIKCRLKVTGCRGQFSGHHKGADECEARALTGHGRSAIAGVPHQGDSPL